jgi:[ribosomal protein S18]-alanine N-acetyltransferase
VTNTEPEVEIRAMAVEDLDQVMAISASFREAPQWPRSAYMSAIAPAAGPWRVALVAEADGEVIGFVTGSLVALQAELESIAVDRAVHRRGIGAALLESLIREAASAGAEEILLEVRVSNLRALQLYGRAGFVEVGRRRGYYLDPAEDAILMRYQIRSQGLPAAGLR